MQETRASESQANLQRYLTLKEFGRNFFAEAHVVKTGEVDRNDVAGVRQFVKEAITKTNPEVRASYFEHIIIAPELGARIAEAVKLENPNTVEFVLWLHDLGRLVNPGAYLRNDKIDERLLYEFRLPEKIRNLVPSIQTWLEAGAGLKLSEKQLAFEEELNPDQSKAADEFFESMSPIQRIIYFSDCFGKRGKTGIFDRTSFMEYLKTQEERYQDESLWPSIAWANAKRRDGAVLTAHVIDNIHKWLQDLGVDVEAILGSLGGYGPKFIIVARHGEVANPKNIVYNRDTVMTADDVIHLSEKGHQQMRLLTNVLRTRNFRIKKIEMSPNIRVKESTREIAKVLGFSGDATISSDLDEVYAPGPYLSGISMDDFQKIDGDAYDPQRWGKYNHESPESVIDRLDKSFWQMAGDLQTGQTGVLVSHGDPIAWFINHLVSGRIPEPKALRKLIYPKKGEAIVVIVDPQGKFFTHYMLTDPSLIEGQSY